jgi:REP element-mobilizing transposase RayT
VARKPRLQVAGGIYHVYARGNDGRDIFIDDERRQRYLTLLARTVRRQDWRCLSYCLMTNHVHLLLETSAADLAVGMQQFHGAYVQHFNRREDRRGPLFQGRYGSTLVETDAQLVMTVGYIAHNPVKAGLVERAGEWRWSSHAATVGRAARPAWLDVQRLMGLLGGWGGDPRERYRDLVAGRGVTTSTSLV